MKNKDNKKEQINLSVYGKVPPHATELEEVVLGALMQEDLYSEVSTMLKPEYFYKPTHQAVYKAITEVAAFNLRVDLISVVTRLKDVGELENCGGPYGVSKLTNSVVSTVNVFNHSKIIVQKFMLREMIRISGEVINNSFEDGADPFELLNSAESELQTISDHLSFGDMKGSDIVMVETLQAIERNRQLYKEHGRIPITGVPSGINNLDMLTLGWQPGDLIIIGARPSVGKTAFALGVAREAARFFRYQFTEKKAKFKKVALFSLEMKANRLMIRILSRESKIPLHELKSGSIADNEMMKLQNGHANALAKEGILFDDHSGLNTRAIVSKLKKLAKKGELGLIVIDYLQLMTAVKTNSGQNREQDISGISRDLKNIAQDFEVPVIALSQLSRDIEKRKEGSVPILSDLRESGAIEQDADLVAFLYGHSEESIKQDASLKNRRFIKIAKQRDGMLDTIELSADMSIQLIEELTDDRQFKPIPQQHFAGNRNDKGDDMPF
jgi:replicative DNA helicase